MAITILERTEDVSRDAVTVTRKFRCDWAERVPFINQLMGGFVRVGNGVRFILPARDHVYRFAFVDKVAVKGFGAIVGGASEAYQGADLTVTYSTLDAPDSDDDAKPPEEKELFKESWNFGLQRLTLPTQYYTYELANPVFVPARTGINATKSIPTIEYTLVRMFGTKIPYKAITELMGRVNENPVVIAGRQWASETVRFDGIAATRAISTRGFKFYEITYKFAIMPLVDKVAVSPDFAPSPTYPLGQPGETIIAAVGWNRVYRPDRGYWERVYVRDTDPKIYPNQYDSEIKQGKVKGFALLFSRRAT
jgi:hypothetical protein